MARLTQLSIEGFRSISDQVVLNFPAHQPVVLIGENNAGKSNIIRAIELMFGEFHPKYKKLEDYDYYKRDCNTPVMELERKVENFPNSYEVKHNKEAHKMLLYWIGKDGFIWVNGALQNGGTTIPDMADVANQIDAPELTRQIERIRNSVDVDPSLAIGTAKELLETVCKSILSERNIEVPKNDDITELVKAVRKSLVLLPEDIDDSAKGSDIIRRLLSNLGTVAQGIAELRNLYGTGHGKHGKAKGISPRHARLAVNASTALATFLYETHWERQ